MSWMASDAKVLSDIRAETVAGGLARGWLFRAYCPGCRAWKDVAAHRLEPHGDIGAVRLVGRLRCLCGVRASRLRILWSGSVIFEASYASCSRDGGA